MRKRRKAGKSLSSWRRKGRIAPLAPESPVDGRGGWERLFALGRSIEHGFAVPVLPSPSRPRHRESDLPIMGMVVIANDIDGGSDDTGGDEPAGF